MTVHSPLRLTQWGECGRTNSLSNGLTTIITQ